MESQKKPVVRRDYYFDEALNVTIDYLKALAGVDRACRHREGA